MNQLAKATKKFIPATNASTSILMNQEIAIGGVKKCITIKLIPSTHIKHKLDCIMVQYRENMKPVTGWKIELNELKPESIGFKSNDTPHRIEYDINKDTWAKRPNYDEVKIMISELINFTRILNEHS